MKKSTSTAMQEQIRFIKEYYTSLDMYNFKNILKTNFKVTDYSTELLRNILQKQKAKIEKIPFSQTIYM